MFTLPIPFVEKGAAKTWDIMQGYDLSLTDCTCASTASTDTSIIEAQLNNALDTLNEIYLELAQQNVNVEQTTIYATTGGTIPAGVQSYTIINLGTDPNDPLAPSNSMIINSLVVNTKVLSYGNSTDTNQVLADPVSYDPNGNTLLITYNMPI